MNVLQRTSRGYKQDPTKYFEFKKYEKKCGDFVLIEAAFEEAHQWEQFGLKDEELKKILKKKIVRLEFEEPNKFFIGDNPGSYDFHFYRIFTLCPYTSDWLNNRYKTKKRVPIFFPFNKLYIPKDVKKKYDAIYTGHIVSKEVLEDINILSKFKYRFVSNSSHSLVTNKGVSYSDKMKLISESRITLVHNLLYPKPYHIFNIWKINDYKENRAFKLIPKRFDFYKLLRSSKFVVPQLKSRVFEAAFGKSLILCKKDPFNVIERYFEPEKEFIYFEENNLEERIVDILKNYSVYQKVIENAYKKAVNNYTVDSFVNKYLKDI